MKRNRLLVLSLLACTLLTGCDEGSTVTNGSDYVGNVNFGSGDADKLDTNLNLQKFYETLKTSSGGSEAVQKLLEKIASIEYSDDSLANMSNGDTFDVRDYHTTATLQKDIAKTFEDIVDGTTYLDDDGNFDPEAYKEYVTETLDFDVADGQTSEKYIADATLRAKLAYNYDEYIEKSIKPNILIDYIYLDYVTGSTKYKSQFSNQYGVKLEVLKMDYDTTKLNGAWNEALVKDVKAITSGKTTDYKFGTNYSFVTFNSDNEMIVFRSEADKLSYSVYTLTDADVDKYVPAYVKIDGKTPFRQWDLSKEADNNAVKAVEASATKVADKSWEITTATTPDGDFYKHVEEIIIARKLWKIDYEIVLAKNYDYKTSYYDAMTETEKTEAQGFSSTYSSSNSKPIKEVAKSNKITAQQSKYYTEPEFYTRSSYTNVLPSTLSSLRGTSAKDLMPHLVSFKDGASVYTLDDIETKSDVNDFFLLPKNDVSDPVYLDTASNTYYICEVSAWYGLYRTIDPLKSTSPSKTISNYQIEAYQAGKMSTWQLNDSQTSWVEKAQDTNIDYQSKPEAFDNVIGLVQESADDIITDAIKKEAIVALFEKYALEINDQEIYDYILGQYPDYFEED